ncbi:MAG: sialidase family protein, partial [Bacteroidales bacterium]
VLAYKDKLIASWSSGIWNEDEPGQNMLMSVSEDLGITWSEPITIFGPRKGIYNDVVFTAMGIRNLGDTLIAYTGVYEYDSILTVKQDHVFPHTKPGYISKYELYTYINVATEIKISTDDGKTWSEAKVLMENFVPNHAPVETSSGRLIMPGNISFPWTDDPTGLRGWEKAAIPRLPDNYTDAPVRFRESFKYRGDTVQWLEASFYEMKNGTLRMMFRT